MIHKLLIRSLLRRDFLIAVFFLIFLPLFIYNLGGYSLVDFDEAWFAEIARNLFVNKNPLVLYFNNQIFTDHPPLGYWLMAFSFLIFGISEFAARLPSAIFGFGSLIVLYLIGKQLFNRTVGICASLFLVSCVWFIFRTRTGNLDTVFLFFFLLTFYFIFKIKINPKWLILTSVTLGITFLIKMLVGLSMLIPIITYILIVKPTISRKIYLTSVILFGVVVTPWILANYLKVGPWFIQHIFYVGLRPFAKQMPNFFELHRSLTYLYLHYGIRKWFYPSLFAVCGSFFFVRRFRQLLPLYTLLIFLVGGFLTNKKTEIWHLIPLYPFLGLILAFFMYQITDLVLSLTPFRSLKKHIGFIVVSFFLFSSTYQIYNFRNEIRLFDHDTSGLAYTAASASNSSEKLFLYADYFLPSAVFYSRKQVFLVKGETYPLNTLVGIIDYGNKPFLLLSEKWKIELDKINPKKYTVVASYKEYVLIRVD